MSFNLLHSPGHSNTLVLIEPANAMVDGTGDLLGHAHDNGQARILQDEIFHVTAHINDAREVNVSYCREIFIYAGTGP